MARCHHVAVTAAVIPTVTAGMPDCSAEAYFSRLSETVATLAELAADPAGGQLAEILAGDDLALARMRAAADLLRGAGMPIALTGTDAGSAVDLVGQAARWNNYAQGPVTPVHAACGRDMARGLLRVWARRHGPGPRTEAQNRALGRTRLRQAQVRLAGQIRVSCAALRAELRDDAGSLRRGQTAAFTRRAASRAAALARELQDGMDFDLGVSSAVAPAGADVDVPVLRTAALENRLSWLIGVGFGTGTTLTAARLLSEVLPPGGPVMGGAVAVGVTIGGAVVRARGLLCERAAADRWVVELTAALRAALDEHLAARVLAADSPAVGSWSVRDYTRDSSDILAITDGLHARVNLQIAGERPTARDG